MLDLRPEDGEDPPSCLARNLGLARAPEAGKLTDLLQQVPLCAIGIGGTDPTNRHVLDALCWAADLRDAGGVPTLRLLVQCIPTVLEADEAAIWDRVPDRIEELVRSPLRRPGRLCDFIWESSRPGLLRSLFG